MFCSKCGKQVDQGSRFCPHCGYIQKSADRKQHNQEYSNGEMHAGRSQCGEIILGLSAVDIIIAVVYIIIVFWWTSQFLSNLKGTWQIYKFMEMDMKFVGMILYIMPYTLTLCLSLVGILGVRKREYHISTGVIIGILGLIMKIGSMIFDSVGYRSYLIVVQRVFYVYGSIGITSLVLGIGIVVLLYAKINQAR